MRILVAGGAGFIGSHLCEKLLTDGHQVVCLDSFITGRKKNIEHLLKDKNFALIEADVTNPSIINHQPAQPAGGSSIIDYIFHLASPAAPRDFERLPIEILLANSLGTYQLLELAKKNKARFLLASSSEVYGGPMEHPQRESYWGHVNPIGGRSCYDEGKRFAEALCMSYFRKFNLDTRIVRIFNTYGERMRKDDGRVIATFINQALQGKPLTVFGDGSQTRSFCYISDMVDGLIKAMFMSDLGGEVINLGNSNEYQVIEVAKLIKKLTDSQSKIDFLPLPSDDPKKRKPDISQAKKLLNWEPKVGLEAGLKKTIKFYAGR